MTLEDQVRDALDDLVTRVPPRAGLTDTVLRRARRRQTVVRLAAAGGTAVAVAAGTMFVVADPLATDGPDLGTVGPAAGELDDGAPDVAPDQGVAGPVTVSVDAARLTEGAEPAVPWYADGVLHAGGQEFPVGDDISGFRALAEVAGGVAALTVPLTDSKDDPNRYELLLLSRDGGKALGDGAIYDFGVSADGTQIAWAEHDRSTETPDAGHGRTVLYVADATTGEVLHTREQTGDDGSMGVVKGFLADGRVVLDNATNAQGGNALWDPAADTVLRWTDDSFTSTVAPTGDLAVLSPGNEDAKRQRGVVDTATGETVWTLPADHFVGRQAFSPDGGLLAVVATPGRPELGDALESGREPPDADVPRSVVVFDSRTGDPLLTVEGTEPGNLAWEPGGTLVFEAWNEETTAMSLVRCSIDGRCERAAPVRDLTGGEVPYLGGGA